MESGRPRKGWKEEVERDLQVLGVRRWRELVTDREKMEGYYLTGQSPQWAVVPMEKEVKDSMMGTSGILLITYNVPLILLVLLVPLKSTQSCRHGTSTWHSVKNFS